MRYICSSYFAAIFLFMQSLAFAQDENMAINNVDHGKLMSDVIKNDGPGIPPGRSWFEFNIGHVHKKIGHWKTAPGYFDGKTDCYWVAFANNKCGIAIAELADCGAFKVLKTGSSDGVVYYKIKVLESLDKTLSCLQQHPGYINISSVRLEEKISHQIQEWLDGKNNSDYKKDSNRIIVSVQFKDSLSLAEKMTILSGAADSVWEYGKYDPLGIMLALVQRNQLNNIAALEQVTDVHEYCVPQVTNDIARGQTRVSNLQQSVIDTVTTPPSPTPNSGRQYMGDSVYIGIWDTGIDSLHLDLNENISGTPRPRKAAIPGVTYWALPSESHGTHVAGIAMGNGWQSEYSMPYGTTNGRRYQWRGVAPKAKVWPFDMTNTGCSGDVNNHSHIIDYDALYTNSDQDVDNVVCNHDPTTPNVNNVMVYAAANDGGWGYGYSDQTGYYSILADAKNPIKVGATDKFTGNRSEFSSMGPTRDGRIGIDVMAPGAGGGPRYLLEYDSIAIKGTSGIKKVWRFDDPISDLWYSISCARNIKINSSILSVDAYTGIGLQCPTMSPTITSAATDTLILRWRTTKITTSIPTDSFGSYYVGWTGSVDNGSVVFSTRPPTTWQTLKVPFSAMAPYKGTWAGQTISSINFYIGTTAGPGTGVTSCLMGSPYSYTPMQGTSMAAPHVTGIVALMLQRLRDAYGRNIHTNPFWNSTAKAILIHTATDMIQTAFDPGSPNNTDYALGNTANPDTLTTVYGPGPDFATGYGLVNAQKAVQYVDTNLFKELQINQKQTRYFFLDVPAGLTNLRTTLCWDDPGVAQPADPYTKVLCNDIDLKLINLATGQISYPWVYDHSKFHGAGIPANGIDSLITRALVLANPATKGIDTVNNVEVVDISNPAAGQWAVLVTGSNIISDQNPRVSGTNQDVSLVSDLAYTPDTGQAGFVASYNSSKRVMKATMTGDMRLRASSCKISGNYQGLLFKQSGTAYESLDTNGALHATTVSENQAAWLDIPANLTGGLVFRSTLDGQVKACFSTASIARLRGTRRCGAVN